MVCVSLLSDLGLQDASVASAKGILMQYTSCPITDITHLITPYHKQQAAYLLLSAYRNFPADTCHVLLFDVFYSSKPKMVLCRHEGHWFLAPDNGLLGIVFGDAIAEVMACFELELPNQFTTWLHETGKVIRLLSTPEALHSAFKKCALNTDSSRFRPLITANVAECQVIHIDRYENVVINITKAQFIAAANGRNFRIEFARSENITEISTHYGSVREGVKLCRFNTAGYLEISINRGKAASLFGLKIINEGSLIYNNVKIFFE